MPRVVPAARREDDGQRPGAIPHQPVLLGRAGVLADLAGELAGGMGSGPSVVLLHGMAGVGKTATAAWAAHQFEHGFFLAADADEAERAAVLRAATTAPRGLLVLDDVTSAAQVRSLLPANPGCAVLLTSRTRGSGMPCTARVELPPLPQSAATVLFSTVVGTVRAAREPAALARLVDATAGVPALVLSIAEQVRDRSDSSLVDCADRLMIASIGSHLRGLFDRCYTELDPAQAKALRVAAGQQCEVTAAAVATVTDQPVHRADALLAELFECGLLDRARLGVYRLPPLVREYVLARVREIEPLTDMCARVAKLTRHLVLDGARAATLVRPRHRPIVPGPRR